MAAAKDGFFGLAKGADITDMNVEYAEALLNFARHIDATGGVLEASKWGKSSLLVDSLLTTCFLQDPPNDEFSSQKISFLDGSVADINDAASV